MRGYEYVRFSKSDLDLNEAFIFRNPFAKRFSTKPPMLANFKIR